MNFKFLYPLGCLLLFLGLLWLFLPHAAHEKVTGEAETLHIEHLFQGIILTLAGLALILIHNNKEAKAQKSKPKR